MSAGAAPSLRLATTVAPRSSGVSTRQASPIDTMPVHSGGAIGICSVTATLVRPDANASGSPTSVDQPFLAPRTSSVGSATRPSSLSDIGPRVSASALSAWRCDLAFSWLVSVPASAWQP